MTKLFFNKQELPQSLYYYKEEKGEICCRNKARYFGKMRSTADVGMDNENHDAFSDRSIR